VTLAYAHNDFALSQWASKINSSLASFFLARSENYLNVWSRKDGFFCSRFRNGTFDCPSNKLNVFSDNFVEGDAWHYRFYGTDVLRTFNSSQQFVTELDTFMTRGRIDPLNVLPNP
jgi:putative alpha-1,2-mannosidase